MFLRNAWYVAAWDHEVRVGTLFGRILLGEPVVFFRRRDGRVVALEDRCCHRHYPLHKGKLADDCIQCHYHGFTYDSAAQGSAGAEDGGLRGRGPARRRHRDA